jgi:hypothetical protein
MHRPGRRQIGPQHDGHVRCSGRWGCIVPAPARTSIYRSLAHVCRPHDNMPSFHHSGILWSAGKVQCHVAPSEPVEQASPASRFVTDLFLVQPSVGGRGRRAIVI